MIINLKGKIFGGFGEGKEYANLDWAIKQFEEKVHFKPYPGTLNIRLSNNNDKLSLFEKYEGKKITPPLGYVSGKCFDAIIMKQVRGAVIITEYSKYDQNVLEIIAPVNLREKFSLNDGDEISIDIFLE